MFFNGGNNSILINVGFEKIALEICYDIEIEEHIQNAVKSNASGGEKMSFSETCIFQVKPEKCDEFEAIVKELKVFLGNFEGINSYSFMKRTHRITDMDSIREGKPPKMLTRIIKSVKYIMYFEMDDEKVHGIFTRELFRQFDKRISKCLIMPANKFIGTVI